MTRSNPPAIIFPAHIPAFATLALGSALPLHPQHALHTFSSLHHTLPCRPPNPDTISRLFSPPFPHLPSLSLSQASRRPSVHRTLIGDGCWRLAAASCAPGSLGWRCGGGGGGDRGHIPQRVDCCTCACVSLCGLIACAWRESPICMDRGARGERGRERGESLILFVDAK